VATQTQSDLQTPTQNPFEEYVKAGWVLCPIVNGQKGPRSKSWNKRENGITDTKTAAALQAAGLCHAYSNTAVLDVDDLDRANSYLDQRGIVLADLMLAPGAVQIVSGRPNRLKLLYRLESSLPSKSFDNGAFELRSGTANGCTVQDVLPPSVHPLTQKPYTWLGDWRNLPPIPQCLLNIWKQEIERQKGTELLKPVGSTANLGELRELLSRRDPDGAYDAWIRTGMCVHHEMGGSDEGFALWDEWSALGSKYPGTEKLRIHWRSFGNSATPVTIDSLRKTDSAVIEDFEDVSGAISDFNNVAKRRSKKGKLAVLCMADVSPVAVDWVWESRIPLGNLTMLDGDPGVGKSTICATLAANVSNGASGFRQGSILWLSAEDDPGNATKPRLLAAGANCQKIFVVPEPFDFDADGIERLRTLIEEHKPLFVIIDPVSAYMGETDTNADNKVRKVLSPLKEIAAEFGIAILCVRHLTKGGRDKAIYRGSGSIAFTGAARSVLLAGQSTKDKSQSALVHIKCNVGKMANPLGYRLETCTIAGIETARLKWTGESEVQAEDILGSEFNAVADKSSAVDEAEEFLRRELSGGPRPQKETEREAKKWNISSAALRRAKGRLDVESEKNGRGNWMWSLPMINAE
jgi:hypothetical protein